MATRSCTDNDAFTTSPTATLTFSADSVKMDTVFSNVGSRTYDFWVYNRSTRGVRLQSVRLQQGNQTGFRVNVDGSYLDNTLGSVVSDLEVRSGDSLRVFVELTAPYNRQSAPQLIEDRLVFTLESGVQQHVTLWAHAWDALIADSIIVSRDTLIESRQPIVVMNGIRVDSCATLTVRNTTLYFHDKAGIDVYGTIMTDSVVMRGDRLDHMFDYLPYDRVSGQWGSDGGVVIHTSSTGNVMRDTEIRNAGQYGILCDSAAIDDSVLRLDMERCVVHNCTGSGVASYNANIRLRQCQITNNGGECLSVVGGRADVSRCTIAQFYPFVGGRGPAVFLANSTPLLSFICDSSIVTGYDDDVMLGEASADTTSVFEYSFSNSLLRTPRVETDDSVRYTNIIWESPDDSIQGKQHFRLIDERNLIYDFHLDSLSTAVGLGCYD